MTSVEFAMYLILTVGRLDAIRKAREWVLTTCANSQSADPRNHALQDVSEPRYNIQDILGIANPDIRAPLDMMEILLRVVDDSRLEVFKPQFGRGCITAWAHIHGEVRTDSRQSTQLT